MPCVPAPTQLSHKWLGFTKRQDLKLSAGLDVNWPIGAREPKAVSSQAALRCSARVTPRHVAHWLTEGLP